MSPILDIMIYIVCIYFTYIHGKTLDKIQLNEISSVLYFTYLICFILSIQQSYTLALEWVAITAIMWHIHTYALPYKRLSFNATTCR